jgi:3-demethoxyubiquinol 3-hydroxylase
MSGSFTQSDAPPMPHSLSAKAFLAQALRVNHAGEYGAQRIYAGQLAVLSKAACAPQLHEMREQEIEHLRYFEHALPQRKVRPTALLPFWHVAGYALGAATALMGERAAMACTVAVEEVIADHYQEQLDMLPDDTEAELKSTIAQFRADEMEHHAIGIAHEAEQAPAYRALTGVIRVGCRAAIWVSKRV